MRVAKLAVACCLLAAAVAGCGSAPVGDVRSTPQALKIKALFADLDEIPRGFATRSRPGWEKPFEPVVQECRRLFNLMAGRPAREGLTAATTASYLGEGVGQTAAVSLALYGSGEAAEQMDELAKASRACTTARDQTPGEVNRLTVAPLAVSEKVLEGGGVARRLVGRVGGYPYEMHLVVARQGGAVIGVVNAGMSGADARTTEELARLVSRKVATLDL
ncbi:hypothetical protein GT755_15530 [Herbidospora sp. NEAU-GS84]|uniref:Lipoprotein n=1 Tax=Herbidospora solisilvae TaxID=2696284 RepID=A0A7C9P0F1_9ACTN|nr:hypothetical protein [Herbidospora solisilvae]NAS23097.1 hypothetical protein [Herbidospora solisilvae]